MKKNVNGIEIEMTAEEITAKENQDALDLAVAQQEQEEIDAKEVLKSSAKAKLIAGEALTEEEADTIVL